MIPISELGIDFHEAEKWARKYLCVDCDEYTLVVAWGGAFGINEYVIRCGRNKDHTQFVKGKSYSQLYDEGYALPIEIVNGILRRRRKEQQNVY